MANEFKVKNGLISYGNIVPSGSYTLGTSGNPWQELFVTSGSIYMDGVKLSVLNDDLAVDDENIIKAITENVSFYVSPSGNDTTGDGTSGSPWATINQAYEYLYSRQILGDASATIYLSGGINENHTATVTCRHPNGNKINIVGQALSSTTYTMVEVSGSSTDFEIEYTLSGSTGFEIGDYVKISNFNTPDTWLSGTAYDIGDVIKEPVATTSYHRCKIAGTSHTVAPTWNTDFGGDTVDNTVTWTKIEPRRLYGAYKITGKSGDKIKIAHKIAVGSLMGSPTALTGTIYKFNSGIKMPTGVPFINLQKNRALQTLANLVIIGTDRTNGSQVGIYVQEGSFVEASNISLIDMYVGLYLTNCFATFSTFTCNKAYTYGIWCRQGVANIYIPNCILNEGYTTGSGINNDGGRLYIGAGTVVGNLNGISASNGAYVDFTAGVCNSNDSTNFSPAVNTVGNANSYIKN